MSSILANYSFLISAGVAVAVTIAVGYFFGPMEESQSNPSKHKAGPHAHHGGRDEREAEAALQKMMQEFTGLINQKHFNEAEEKANEILEFTANTWGKNHMNYGLLMGIPIAQLYELTENFAKMEACLKEAYHILASHGPDFLAETGITDKLATLYSQQSNYTEASKYALVSLDTRKAFFRQQPSKETYEKYCVYVLKTGTILANAGMFKRSLELYKDTIRLGMDIDPSSNQFYPCLEAYSNILHQQGKTIEAIHQLEEYRKNLARSPIAVQTVRKILQRIAVLYFTIDRFSDALQYLNSYKKISEEKQLTIPIQLLCELASVYWELGNPDEAIATQQLMKGSPLNYTTPPITRSRYLATIESTFQKGPNQMVLYHLHLRVNRELPNRKENDPYEDPRHIKRRLESCFLVVRFEATVPKDEQATITYQVTQDKLHSFEIRSPPMPAPDNGKFYEVAIDVYEDSTQRNKLGQHHQLVLSIPPQAFRFA